MTAEVTAVYKGVSANILKAAEKMPEADFTRLSQRLRSELLDN